MKRLAPPLLLILMLTCVSAARAATLTPDSTFILGGAPSLLAPLPAPVADSASGPQSVDQTGRFVAFASNSDGLSAAADPAVTNIYVKDRLTGAVTLVSRQTGTDGAPTSQDCFLPAISDDGSHVAFVCDGALDPADNNDKPDVYVRELATGKTILVSRATGADGAVGNGDSESPALNADGSRIAFDSDSTNLGGTTDGSRQVYVRVLPSVASSGATLLVSIAGGAGAPMPDGDSQSPSIDDNGDTIGFESKATNLAAGDTNGTTDVFVHSISKNTTRLESRAGGAGGAIGNDASTNAEVSGDGGVIVFQSYATNLVPKDTTGDPDIYERSLTSEGILLVDQQGGVKATGGAMSPSVDDDGAAVAFLSVAGNLDPADKGSGVDTFVARPGPTITLVSRADGAASPAANSSTPFFGSPSVSGDGKDVLFDTLGSVTGDAIPDVETLSIRDLAANSTESVARPAGSAPFSNQGGLARAAVLSADGRYAAFSTSAPGAGLPAGVDEGVVVRDTVTGATFFASDGTNGAPLPDAHDPSISANGRRVAFTDSDSVWVRDLVTGSTILVSRATGANGAVANGASFEPSISADGNRVEFLSAATNLGDGDTDAIVDSHVRDIAAGTTVLASRANGAAGAKGNNAVSDAALSGDGRHVAFSTTATNLGDGDTDATLDVHVRDLAAGATRLADVSSGGAKANQLAEEPTIDADGTHVAFASPATNLATATFPAGQYQIWVRNMAASTTVLASRADGAAGAPGDKTSDEPGLSPDGHVVAYRSSADNLAPGLPPGYQVLRRNLDAGSTQIVSRGRGPDGAPEAGGASFAPGGITTDGSCVAFGGSGGLLGSVAGSTDYEQSYLRVFSRDCGGRTGVAFGPTDTTAPQLRAVSLTHTRFRVAKAATPVAAKRRRRIARGTVLRFTSSEAAKLAIVIERLPAPHGHGRARKLATLTRGVASGAGRISLSGRIGKRRLSAARYRLTLTERDVAGNVSKPVRLTFTVLGG